MRKTATHAGTFRIASPPAAVEAAILSEAYNLELERSREGVQDTEYHLLTQTDEIYEFEVRTREHRRKKTGGLDRNTSIHSTNRSRYDRRAKTLTWVYEGLGGHRIQVSGSYKIRDDGAGATEVAHSTSVRVDVPVIGGRIASIILGEMDAAFLRIPLILRRHSASR
jgi:hypothetical protein